MIDLMEKVFHLNSRKTNIKIEIIAGFTTFITLSYIIFVNPTILSQAGIPKEAAIGATIYSTIIATLLMGLWANLPIAVAPGMGLNAFFTYTVVIGMGLPWETALGAVFVSGIFFFILSITNIRKAIFMGIPTVLRTSIAVGIGLFIALIGFKNAGIIVENKDTLVSFGHLLSPGVLVALLGLLITATLMSKGTKGAILIGILLTTLFSIIFGITKAPTSVSNLISFSVPNVSDTLLKMNLLGAIHYGILGIIFTFSIVELFDNMGTLIGLTTKGKIIDRDGNIPNLNKALVSDSIGTMISAILGTSTVTSYIESAAGIAEGGRTGLSALVVALCFGLAVIFTPLIGIVPAVATSPALIMVGTLMFSEIHRIDFSDLTESFPAFMTIILMPLSFSIANGIAAGFISYVSLKALAGKFKEINLVSLVIAIAFLINFVLRLH
ncbi:putative MFS transporter, AGZA family, xanthine/uracil permease [Thermodesulfobium acidiphilum]|uniref:Putative MFS transporter, AGZA family, xanthine/uracil permease n=1 Tax=Thermodesulfobium acidiphilum TaxID=1794699 RepID=A0A2R4VYS7_THEAF|nr:NCS2 family permease [Thermodesulfobium acidiphilum]AWB09614.1 putative MFS transporter, AGZA family, xanthine/uracil permease [Thermodesulfobium acidiphilum]